jgi:peptidoglycan/xylan/chitin deacetylase (PgdA/CDA1 family)
MSSCVHPSFAPNGLLRPCLGAFLILIAAAFCAKALDYSCSNCTPPDCVCASVQPPGGLRATNTPQIILITFDDSVHTASYAVCQQILTNRFNPNGTPIQATFYVQSKWSDYRLVQQLYAQGHEIAIHTMSHTTTTNTDLATWRREIYGCRKALSDLAQIPLEEIVGFRAPGLDYNHASFRALAEAGLEYDASVTEGLGGLSTSGSSEIWPYTLDNGLGQIAYKPPPQTNFPGLFEVPVWQMLDQYGAMASTMDFPAGTTNEILDIFKLNFENRYFGNRAPMGLFMHANWLGAESWRVDLLNEFISWAQTFTNVWFVSTHAAVEFTRNPVGVAAATSFPPFVTMQKTIPPGTSVVTCVYTTDTFTTCAECPLVYPGPDCVFGKASATTGGVMEIVIVNQYATQYSAELRISNDTDKTIVDWEAEFRTYRGQLEILTPGVYTTSVAGTGTKVVVHPYSTTRPLFPGEVETNYFWVTNTQGSVFIPDQKVTLFELTPKQPTISPAVVFVDSNRVVTGWDNSAANYLLMFTTNQDFSNWQEVEVHGRTSMVTVLPPETERAYFKLKTVY